MKKRLIWTGSILVALFVLLLVLAMTVDITPDSVIKLYAVDSPPVPKEIVYNDFWSSMDALEFDYIGLDRLTDPELGLFASAASALAHGNISHAKEIASRLSSTTADSVIKLYTGDLYYNALIAGNEWPAYFNESPTYAEMAAGDSSSVCLPDNRLLVEGWQKPPLETWDWNSERIVLPLKENRVGHAMVEVEVNGVAKWFVIDTGADMSVITSKIAVKAGIDPLMETSGRARTSNASTVDVRPASVQTLKVGDLTINNHRVLYIASENLEFKLFGFPLFKIEGILGWNAIRRMHLELDYENGEVVIEKPAPAHMNEYSDPDFIWACESNPLVRLLAEDGTPLWLFLDTGANETRLYHHVYRKLELDIAGQNQTTTGGAGGFDLESYDEILDLSLYLGSNHFLFPTITVRHEAEPTTRYGVPEIWFKVDGVIGFDLACQGRMVIDLPAGKFEIHPPGD